MNISQLEAKRREKLRARTTPIVAPRPIPNSGAIVEAATAALEEKRNRCREFEQRWEAWAREAELPKCPKHGTELPVDIPRSKRVSWELEQMVAEPLECPVCRVERAREIYRRQLLKAGVPQSLSHCRLSNYEAQTEAERLALAKSSDFARRTSGGLLILGQSVGVGKSHLAVAILAERNCRGRFIHWMDFLTAVRGTYSTGGRDELVKPVRNAELLVIDELGFSTGGADELPLFQELVGARYQERRPFVITGNFAGADELKRVVGLRIYDRLSESVVATLRLEGQSRRASRREQYLGVETNPEKA